MRPRSGDWPGARRFRRLTPAVIRYRSFPLVLVALGLALATTLSACSNSSGTAVSVNGTSVSNADFTHWLSEIAGDDAYTKVALVDSTTQQPVKIHGTNSSTYSTLFTSQVLDQQVTFTIAAQEVARRHLHVSQSDLTAIENQFAQALSGSQSSTTAASTPSADGQAALDKLGSYKDVLIRGYADRQAVIADITKKLNNDTALRAAYAKAKDQFKDQVCVSVIAIAAGNGPTQDQSTGALTPPPDSDYPAALTKANAALAQIKGGADFATVAKSSSSDTQSGANGGDIGCVAKGAFTQNQLPELDPIVNSIAVGQVSDPVKTVYGYFLVKVRARGDLTFEEAKDQLVQALPTQAQSAYADLVQAQAKKADVTVDPQWGSWNKKAAHVIPPLGATSTTSTTAKAPAGSLDLGSGAGAGTGSATTPTDVAGSSTTTSPP